MTVEGQAAQWRMVGDGGTVKLRHFCPTCGSPVYMTFPDMPDLFIVRAASLDEPARYQPQMTVWTDAAHAWDRTDPALPRYAKMPPQG